VTDWRRIVWLASYPKSGNTWVRLFLDAYLTGDVDINDIICSVTDNRADRMQIGDGSDIVKLPVDIRHMARPMGLLRLVSAFNENQFANVPLFVKTHSAHMLVNGIELLPESLTKAVIYIIRDPRDVAPSLAKHFGVDLDTTVEYMCDRYRMLKADQIRCGDLLSSWDAHVNSYLNSDSHNVLWLQYEAMRENPVESFSLILRHAGIDPDRARVEAALEKVSLSRLRDLEAEQGFAESSPHAKNQFFGEGTIGNDKLTIRQRYTLEREFKRPMKRLGYLDNAKVSKWH
jgi:hypothetical protein